ncbi:hypothetical protein [Nonomuraea jiangxiensis]|uniref:DUF8094 domain-containing protein n=1 Tax=Nonomuraea jiangxiensis TaxID=633440 RepID=A0A1G8EYC5_9ACTN|nr:hypothetical protein [Nonomuraea jiangxiensis]SDH74911.1 hypothetical protein SAMN05421869_103143 [Nonomuraea jiangxiensis]
MRAYGRRKALALAVGVLAAVTACSGDGRPAATKSAMATSPTPSPTLTSPAVTRSEAAQVFDEITLTDDALRARSGDAAVRTALEGRLRLAKDQLIGGQAQLTEAAYLSTGYAPHRYRWGAPTLFVPRFPQEEKAPWFSALAPRDGHPTLLTFAKSDRWRLSSAAELQPGQELPQIELDAEGYATPVASDDKTITISPQFMGPVHASVAETGSAGVTGGLLAAGPNTTEVAEQIAAFREKAKADGFSYDSIFSADNFPVYALRTANGGALIQYSLSRSTTTTTKTAEDDFIPVPDEARWAISDRVVRRSLKLTETHQFATAVPPLTAPAAAVVIAHDGALTRASGT